MNPIHVVRFLLVSVLLLLVAALGFLAPKFAAKLAAGLENEALWLEGEMVMYAVVNTKSTVVTNADATPVDLSGAYLIHGRLREVVGTVEAANGDSIGSTYRLGRVWSGSRVAEVLLSCDAITTCAGDVGLYDTAANGGAVVDADLFASAQSLAAALNDSNVTHESGVFNIDDVEKRLWEALGLTEDPKKWYDVVVTLTAAAGSAGTISLKTRYVDGT